jgi:predicted Zn-dependent peptidase
LSNIRITELENGIRIVTEIIPYLQSFSLGFWFNVGTRDENLHNNGISHFIEHMLFKGTSKRTAKQISDSIEAYGGYLNAFTSKEHTCFYGRGLAKNIERTFDVISDMVQNPLFKESHIKKESGVVVDELLDIHDNPEELIFDKFEEILFKGSTLSYPVIGKENNIKRFTSTELHDFHNKYYGNKNLLISCSGAVDHDKIVELTRKYVVNNRDSKGKRKFQNIEPQTFVKVIEKEIQQVHCIIGRTSFGYKDEERLILNMLSNLIGDGSSSRLFQAVREKLGITYQINSFVNSYFDTSAFGVYFSTSEKYVEKVISIVAKELKKLTEMKVSDKELKRVKEYLKGSMLLSLENTSNRMIRIANSMLYFNKVITVDELVERIDSVTSEQLLQLSSQLLKEDELARLIIRAKNNNTKAA